MIKKFIVKGLVQGIGYRPWVARLAEELNILGWVRNTGGIVTVCAEGQESALDEMELRLSQDVPTGGFVQEVETIVVDQDSEYKEFTIIPSDQDVQANLPLIPADIATCDRCAKELLDPGNRRYMHPFISCTICGPRYSIIEKLPYDRDTITMGDFSMCPECEREYTAKDDRRRHAQTIACPDCGPVLQFKVISECNKPQNDDFAGNLAENTIHRFFTSEFLDNSNGQKPQIIEAIRLLLQGGIVAIKDIGGYHLACDPKNEDAVAALRLLKHREAKAFAVMFDGLEQVREYCQVNPKEAELLTGPARPIVLVKRKSDEMPEGNRLADNVCLTSPDIGAMLPCNPVQIILAKACGPLIMTSGNASGDVLETEDDRMREWLEARAASEEMQGVAIGMLSHNRRILRPMDDSVMKVVKGRQQFIRRARGYVPTPIPVDISGELYSAGGDLKSSFCFTKNGLAYVSQYLGDMESVSCQHFYNNERNAMISIFGFNPESSAVDKHPGYFSKGSGVTFSESRGIKCKEIQHHEAHVASVIAEHHLQGRVLGFAFDGTGYGDDGSIWGGETFLWDGQSMTRVAHLKTMRLIGGDEGAKNCDTILEGMLHGNDIAPREITMESQLIRAALDKNINTVKSSSMGRLFDAVSALLDICHYNTYEGQAPIELENVAAGTTDSYPLHIGAGGDTRQLFEDIVYAISGGVDKASIARGFIYAVADYIVDVAKSYESQLDDGRQVVLSGGTFLNRILLERAITSLEAMGFSVYTAEALPPGDGGICLGQAFLSQF